MMHLIAFFATIITINLLFVLFVHCMIDLWVICIMHVYWHKLYLIKYSVHVIKHRRCGREIEWIIKKNVRELALQAIVEIRWI